MRPRKAAECVRVRELLQIIIHPNHFGMVEIVGAHRGEDGKRGLVGRVSLRQEPCSTQEQPGRKFTHLSDVCTVTRSAVKDSKTVTTRGARETAFRVVIHYLG